MLSAGFKSRSQTAAAAIGSYEQFVLLLAVRGSC